MMAMYSLTDANACKPTSILHFQDDAHRVVGYARVFHLMSLVRNEHYSHE